MYLCVLDVGDQTLAHYNMPASAEMLKRALVRFAGSDLVVGVEYVSTWNWIAEFCAERNIPFVPGHALYMKAIYGLKTKNDKVDSKKIAMLLRSGMLL